MTQRFVDNYLLFQLAAVSHSFSADFYDHLRTHGLSPAKWRVLVNLVDRDGMKLTDLARKVLFEQSRVSRIVDQLSTDGLAERRSSNTDRRQVRVHITADGRRRVVPLIAAAQAHEDHVLTGLPARDRQRLKTILARLVNQFV